MFLRKVLEVLSDLWSICVEAGPVRIGLEAICVGVCRPVRFIRALSKNAFLVDLHITSTTWVAVLVPEMR